jgi:hypothetical protein
VADEIWRAISDIVWQKIRSSGDHGILFGKY